jgi:perosamine synthetase
MDQASATYKEVVRSTFSYLKQALYPDQLRERRIPLAPDTGYLVPVAEVHARDSDLIATLARWREQNTFWYPTQFRVGTAAWLRSQVLDVGDRILFLVMDGQETPVGHLGLAHAVNDRRDMKVDNVMRGERGCRPGIMSRALRTMLDWAEQTLGPRLIYLPVFRDNEHAIQFYRRLGFRDERLVPLRRHQEGDRVCYRPLTEDDRAAPDRYHLRMTYTPAA